MKQNLLIRADASVEIGTGHVMRCLTLAKALRLRGADSRFVCRAHQGNLVERIRQDGFEVHVLPVAPPSITGDGEDTALAHSAWLGASWQSDAKQTIETLDGWHPDWVIVDHYALDSRWEAKIRPFCKKIMVIDDLADRSHVTNVLIDPTFGETEERYWNLVSKDCEIRCGSQFALLRPQFRERRSLLENRCLRTPPKTMHVFFGGSDPVNYTAKFCRILLTEFEELAIHAAAGQGYAFEPDLTKLASDFSGMFAWEIGVYDMAAHMGACDIALGAPGGATWERACLGLPALYFAVSQNQVPILKHLEKVGICLYGGEAKSVEKSELLFAVERFLSNPSRLAQVKEVGMRAVDGLGATRIADLLENLL